MPAIRQATNDLHRHIDSHCTICKTAINVSEFNRYRDCDHQWRTGNAAGNTVVCYVLRVLLLI